MFEKLPKLPGKLGEILPKSRGPDSTKCYTLADLIEEIKQIEPTPRALFLIGRELIYHELLFCKRNLGEEHEITQHFTDLLEFMQSGYEQRLVRGELGVGSNTPSTAIDHFLSDKPALFFEYPLGRSKKQIRRILNIAKEQTAKDNAEYEKMIDGIKKAIEEEPENEDLWNQLRLVLWLTGCHEEATEAFEKAKKLGWDPETSKLVAI
ncbi:MAG: hypothetical protein BAJATHORv1_100048 [Candidatus Thorarchaeota archaeon]|nr:MAG: hypothetical protein BAJATHORv1_100048 [Candidatus Thorarchaeota archaeon]